MNFFRATPLIREKRFKQARNGLLALIVVIPLLLNGGTVNLTESLRLPVLGFLVLVCSGLLLGRRLPRLNTMALMSMLGWNGMQWASVSVSHFPEESVTVALSCSLCIGVFLLLSLVIAHDFSFKRTLVRALSLLTIFLCLLGGMQWLWGEGSLLPPHHDAPYATLGNRAFFAEALVLLLPFAFVGWRVDEKRGWRIAGFVSLCLCVLLIGLSLIRAAWIAAAVELVVFMLSVVNWQRGMKWLAAAGIFLATAVGMLFVPKSADYEKAVLSWRTAEVPLISAQEGSATERVIMWRLTGKLAAARPWLGWGAGTWKYEVQGLGLRGFYQGFATRFYPAAHNDFLQAAAETGLLSLGFLLFFWATGLAAAVKKALHSPNFLAKMEYRAWTAGILGLLVISAFGFPLQLLFPKLLFFTLMAFALQPEQETELLKGGFHLPSAIALGLIGLVAVAGCKIGVSRFRADSATQKVLDAIKKGEWMNAHSQVDQAHNQWYQTESLTTAPVYWYQYIASVNLKEWERAEFAIHEAARIHPHHPQVMLSLAQWHLMQGEFQLAHDVCERGLKIFPDFPEMIRVNEEAVKMLGR